MQRFWVERREQAQWRAEVGELSYQGREPAQRHGLGDGREFCLPAGTRSNVLRVIFSS
jgi:hypothetical protein